MSSQEQQHGSNSYCYDEKDNFLQDMVLATQSRTYLESEHLGRARWKQPNISSKLSNHQWPAESLPLPVGYWFKWKYVLFCNYLRLKCALGNFGEVAVRSNSLAQESLPPMQQMGLCLIQLRSSLQMLLRYKIGACTVIAAHLLGTIRNRGHARLSPFRKKKHLKSEMQNSKEV